MKKILTKLLAVSGMGLLMLTACKKDGTLVTSNGGKPGALTASTNNLTLDKTKLNDASAVITFTFTKADYGFSAAVSNSLQLDAAGDNWANPMSATLPSNVLTQSYSTADFNTLLLHLNLVGGVTSKVNVRIAHSISATVTPVYSNVLSLTVTPYNLASYVFVAGGYNLYTPAIADSLLSATDNGIYVGVIPFTSGSGADGTNANFKILLEKQDFNGNYGWGSTIRQGATTGFPADSTVEALSTAGNDGNLFALSGATDDPNVQIFSNYIRLDLNKNTISLRPTQWSVVGDASPGGWPAGSGNPQSDTDMKFSNTTQTWSVVVKLTAGGGIKFRLNHDWGTSYGSVTTPGVLDMASNNNINITATGTYVVTVDIAHLTYTLVKH